MLDVAIIGAGPSGMVAAAAAAGRGKRCILFEKNEKPGKKLYITGKGRCNITNDCSQEEFFQNVIRNPRFLYSAYAHFDSQAIVDLLHKTGLDTVVERGKRVFPASNKSSDVIRALSAAAEKNGARLRLNCEVKEIVAPDGQITGIELCSGERIETKSVIICTGGLAYPSTGSTGDGYRFASAFGHRVTELSPALCPLETQEDWPFSLSGLTLKNIGLKLLVQGKTVYKDQGEMLFTYFGISGPLVLTASSYLQHCDDAAVILDLKPALSDQVLDQRLLREFSENPAKELQSIMKNLVPSSMAPVMMKLAGLPRELSGSAVSREQRRILVQLLKNITLHMKGKRPFTEAVITRGGVDVKQINPVTMESKLVKGLFFAGEVLDVDALTGGFNLQIAYTTGHAAGTHA
ncbi:MAG: BaiN/RdsA family NAD(P)/FAD-dependent oxidoreductase [Christensenellales bacterium]